MFEHVWSEGHFLAPIVQAGLGMYLDVFVPGNAPIAYKSWILYILLLFLFFFFYEIVFILFDNLVRSLLFVAVHEHTYTYRKLLNI